MLYAIGDIHGMYYPFLELWDKVGFTKQDTIVMMGDYIDRGPDSKLVLDEIMKRMEEGYNIVPLMGNHEHMFIASIYERGILGMRAEEVLGMWLYNGGVDTMRSFGLHEGDYMPDDKYVDFLKSLKFSYATDNYIFVHAGLRPYDKDEQHLQQIKEDILWIREPFVNHPHDFGRKVVFGHTTTNHINPDRSLKPYVDQYKIGIDTGLVFKYDENPKIRARYQEATLTCVALPEERFISV